MKIEISVWPCERGFSGSCNIFNEFMAFPHDQSINDYCFTWYGNKSMSTPLVIDRQ